MEEVHKVAPETRLKLIHLIELDEPTKLSPEGGARAFSIISALTNPELYFHPSLGLSTVYHSLKLKKNLLKYKRYPI